MSENLPHGWTWTTLGKAAKVEWGNTSITKKSYVEHGFPAFSAAGCDGSLPSFEWEGKAVVLSAIGARCGKCFWADGKWTAIKNTIVIQSSDDQISHRFLFHYLNNERRWLNKGSGMPFIPLANARALELPLPPLPEQHRIVEKIEALFSELDKGVEQLKTAAQQLKVYRQSVLKAAFEGKLTEKWRAEQKSSGRLPAEGGFEGKLREEWRTNVILSETKWSEESAYRKVAEGGAGYGTKDESDSSSRQTATGLRMTSAEELLSRIKQEREALAKATGKKLKPIAPLTEKELAELPPLPEGWVWVRLGHLIDEPKYGTARKCAYEVKGKGVLRIPNIVNGVVDASDLKFAKFDEQEIQTYKLEEGDLLTIRSNGSVDLVGKSALVSKKDEAYLFAGYLIRLKPLRNVVNSQYLLGTLNSDPLRHQIEAKAKSTSGVNNINSGELKALIIPLCVLAEQHQIVSEIESRLSVCDKLEETIAASLQQAEALRQSILKKAFEGKLVPQDPNDEPASVLLERIKQEREKAAVKNVAGIKRNSPPRSPSLRKRGGRG